MTRKDYNLIARVIREQYATAEEVDLPGIKRAALALAEELPKDNARFKPELFISAALGE